MTNDTTAFLDRLTALAHQDLGPGTHQQDIDYHVGWLLSLDAQAFSDYLTCLQAAS